MKNKTGYDHRYIIEVDFSSGQFKSAKLKDKKYTKKAISVAKTSFKDCDC